MTSNAHPPAQRVVKVRRDYNTWVANETLEDYALRFTPRSCRRWSELQVANTAFGAAALAGLSCGVWSDLEELTRLRRSQRVFEPLRPQADCDRDYRLWKRAVSRASDWIEH